MEKYKRIIIGVIILLIGVLSFYFYKQYEASSEEVSKLKSDKVTLLEGMKVLKNENNTLLYQVQGLHVTKDELQVENSRLDKLLKDNGIKFKNLNSIITTQQSTIVELKTLLRDSIRIKVVKDTVVIDTLECFNYRDEFNSITGCIEGDTLKATFSSFTALDIVVENIYKHKFLWWQWGIINRKITTTSTNPKVTITDLKLYIPN